MRNRIALPLLALGACLAGCTSSSPGPATTSSSSTGGVSTSGTTSTAATSGRSTTGASSTACSAVDDGGVTGLCSSLTLGSLSTTQVTQLCTDTMVYIGTAIDAAHWCKWQGMKAAESHSPMSDNDVTSTCTSVQNQCETSDAGSAAGIAPYIEWALNASGLGSNLGSCFMGSLDNTCTGSTVAQYSACIRDEAKALLSIINAFPACSKLTLMDDGGNGDASVTDINNAQQTSTRHPPASCASLCSGNLTPPDPASL